ncbi:MAG: hypothetical protein D4R77_10120 [Planctomycetaceae bacterium]|nr:MAG: hypothetical protein D4R77_10120 [Planctomycetaceae bacterium]
MIVVPFRFGDRNFLNICTGLKKLCQLLRCMISHRQICLNDSPRERILAVTIFFGPNPMAMRLGGRSSTEAVFANTGYNF